MCYFRSSALLRLGPGSLLSSSYVHFVSKIPFCINLPYVKSCCLQCFAFSALTLLVGWHLDPDIYPYQHPITHFFTGQMPFLLAQPTASKHWRQFFCDCLTLIICIVSAVITCNLLPVYHSLTLNVVLIGTRCENWVWSNASCYSRWTTVTSHCYLPWHWPQQ